VHLISIDMATFSRSCRSALASLYRLGSQPAATVVLLRDAPAGIECLLLLKSRSQRFGGLHVFPGGAVDTADEVHRDGDLDVTATLTNAATRELHEETKLSMCAGGVTLLSHWLPPAFDVKKRGKAFSTFFVVARAESAASVSVDGSEIVRHQWLTPERAHQLHYDGQLPMLPPTLYTLGTVANAARVASTAAEAVTVLAAATPRSFQLGNVAGAARSFPWVLPSFLRWLLIKQQTTA
jgi:8-oxo-dGTP pyrophosphatase MutT (NUDIX family)